MATREPDQDPKDQSPRAGTDTPLEPGLYVVSTPIGNLGDITKRAERVLRQVDIIACEDTRRTGLLLHQLNISNRLISYHEYNKLRRTPQLIEMLRQGKRIALVSDAGTPGISDPGFYLIRAAIERDFRVIPVPGASALLAALVVAGLPSDRFVFEGFLPKRKGRRQRRLMGLAQEPRTMVFCESARRVAELLGAMKELWGERRVAVCRELTKRYEEVIRGSLSDVLTRLQTRGELKGETVVVVAGYERGNEEPRA